MAKYLNSGFGPLTELYYIIKGKGYPIGEMSSKEEAKFSRWLANQYEYVRTLKGGGTVEEDEVVELLESRIARVEGWCLVDKFEEPIPKTFALTKK